MKTYSIPEIHLLAGSTDDVLTESIFTAFVDGEGLDDENKIKWWKPI